MEHQLTRQGIFNQLTSLLKRWHTLAREGLTFHPGGKPLDQNQSILRSMLIQNFRIGLKDNLEVKVIEVADRMELQVTEGEYKSHAESLKEIDQVNAYLNGCIYPVSSDNSVAAALKLECVELIREELNLIESDIRAGNPVEFSRLEASLERLRKAIL